MKTVLQFSGGADSLAALYVMRPRWNDITVLWLDTGSAYPETRELVERIAQLVPHLHVAHSDKASWEAMNGTAVDVVPERYTLLGHALHGTEGPPLYTSWLRCCAANLWTAMDAATRELGADVVIRGQRAEERRKSPIRSGHVENGVRYEFPLEDWTRAQVFDYCRRECPELLPTYYEHGENTSRDCWDCIAFLDDNRPRIANLTGERRARVELRLSQYRAALKTDLEVLYADVA